MTGRLIKTDPCDLCDDRRTVRAEPPHDVCQANPYGDFESGFCDKLAAVEELEEKAVESAQHWQAKIRHTPADVRRDAIENEAGMYEQWAEELGARFDGDAWIAQCGVSKAVAA